MIESNRDVICAGCSNKFKIGVTAFYRRKRWCGDDVCKSNIDYKVKNANYKKAQKKIKNGTFRHGVEAGLREYIRHRDGFTCKNCLTTDIDKGFQVHHIIPIADGGDDHYTNLILVCHDCHTSIHQEGWELYCEKFKDYTSKLYIKL
jgi:5-methylcytosine-specific restriction endonuclease McrA